jgi:ribosomal-protein-alanine N-acetyltransferase
MTPADIPAALALGRAEGWTQTDADWVRLLTLSADGCFAAEGSDEPVGLVATLRYGHSLGWVGPLVVSPDRRGRGIGSALLDAAVQHLHRSGVETVKVDAAGPERDLFLRAGFTEEYQLARCTAKLDQFHETELVRPTVPVMPELLEEIVAFDAAAFGADRGDLLRSLWEENPAGSFVYRDPAAPDRAVQGFIMVRPDASGFYLGPWEAVGDEVALNLLYQAFGYVGTDQVLSVDICTRCPGAAVLLEPFGFRSQRSAIRMCLGQNLSPGRPERMYGLSGAETG